MQPNESFKHNQDSEVNQSVPSLEDLERSMIEDELDNQQGDNENWPADCGPSEAQIWAAKTDAEHERKVAALTAKGDKMVSDARDEGMDDLIELTKKLKRMGAIDWPVTVPRGSGDTYVVKVDDCDENRYHFFDTLFGPEGSKRRPHLDMFRVKAVDHNGKEVNKNYEPVTLVRAISAAGLQGESGDTLMKAFNAWIKKDERNSLTDTVRVKLPEWDCTPRMESWLTDLFESSTEGVYELNKTFSKYFALSLYGRVMHPGCYAPIIMAIIGAQNCGKSRFGNLISEFMTGQKGCEVAEWDLAQGKVANLRNVTGVSPVVYFPELGGLPRADIKKFRQIATVTRDRFDFKFKDDHTQPRQFVFVLDSNKYESIHRDADGNRRIFVMFAGQTDDKNGKPAWKPQPWKIDYEGFEDVFWQVMAEAAHFWDHYGENGYKKFVDSVVPMVAAHNEEEVRKDRGTMSDEVLDYVLPRVLPRLIGFMEKEGKKPIRLATFIRDNEKVKRKALVIEADDIRELAGKRQDMRLDKISTQRITQKMVNMGAIGISDKTTRYLFPNIFDTATCEVEFAAMVADWYGTGTGTAADGTEVSFNESGGEEAPTFMLGDLGTGAGHKPVIDHPF